MNKKPLVIVLSLAAILGSVLWLYLGAAGRSPRIELTPYRALGEIAAQETGRLLDRKGEVIIVSRDDSGGVDPVLEAQLKHFRAALEKEGVRVAANEKFTVSPREVFLRGSVPRDRFFQVLEAHAGAAAFVLFASLPPMDPNDLNRVKQRGAKLVVIGGFRPGDEALLNSGVMHLAIVPRTGAPPESSPSAGGMRGVFDAYYTILTPKTP